MKTKILVIVSMLMIVAMSWMPSASAWETEGTDTINEDEYWYQTIRFISGDYLTLSYTITVQNDVYIDVILLNEENFNKYENGLSFTYYVEGTDFTTLYTNVPSITLYTHDNYYLVVDNTDEPPGGAKPAWDGVNNYCTFHYTTSGNAHYYPSGGGSSTTWEDDDEDNFGSILGWLIIMIAIGVMVVMVILDGGIVYYKQKKQKLEVPQYPYNRDQQPPPPPDYQPPQHP